jgi:putative transposon-encoded protein
MEIATQVLLPGELTTEGHHIKIKNKPFRINKKISLFFQGTVVLISKLYVPKLHC